MLAQRMKFYFGPLLLYSPQGCAMVHQQSWSVNRIKGYAVCVGIHEFFQLVAVLTGHPACQVEIARHDARLDAVFVLQPVRHDLKLQLTDSAKQQQ